jgi:hypothetical protein
LTIALLFVLPSAAFASCPSVQFFGVRGSGEHSGFGATIGPVLATLNSSGISNIGNQHIDYWALDADVNAFEPKYLSDYVKSVDQGVQVLHDDIASFRNRCRNTPLLLAGYSQGAEVVDDWLLSEVPKYGNNGGSNVIGVALLGDPRFNPALPEDKGSYNTRLGGVSPWQFSWWDPLNPFASPPKPFGTRVSGYPSSDFSLLESFCANHDPICNTIRGAAVIGCGDSTCAHLHYMNLKWGGATYTTDAGAFLANRYKALYGSGSSGGGGSGPSSGGGTTPGGTTPGGTTPGGTTPGGVTTPGGGTTPSGGSQPTYAETTGGVAHTWTDYADAGGTEGPEIASNQTVQIACWVTGFRVSDGNTYWYEIASSPWNDAYYVSADAFYNNGETSGSLLGTPFVDPAVPEC